MTSLLLKFNYRSLSRIAAVSQKTTLIRQPIRFQSTDKENKTSDAGQKEASNKSTKVNRPIPDRGPINWRSFFIGSSALGLLTAYFLYLKNKRHEKIERDKSRSYGKAAIGGSFELVDTEGKTRSSDEFLGKWLLIYFGFTNCPDVCPEELEKLSTVVANIKKQNVDIVPLFISVDPERDTPENVGKYLKEFSDHFIGLTGTKEQVEKATRAYRIYYSVGPKDKDNDYIVDHTIISYLVSPTGELVDYFGQTKLAPEVENTILYTIKTFKP